jgi:hypothetical protein
VKKSKENFLKKKRYTQKKVIIHAISVQKKKKIYPKSANINNKIMTTKIDYRMPSKMLTTCERKTKTSRSLFGKPDAHETERIYNEEMERNRARMMNRYGLDIITEKHSNHSMYTSPKSLPPRSGYPVTERLKDMGNMPVHLQTNIAKMCNDRKPLKNASPMSKNKPFGTTGKLSKTKKKYLL